MKREEHALLSLVAQYVNRLFNAESKNIIEDGDGQVVGESPIGHSPTTCRPTAPAPSDHSPPRRSPPSSPSQKVLRLGVRLPFREAVSRFRRTKEGPGKS